MPLGEADREASLSAADSGVEGVVVVPLTGDAEADEAAIEEAIAGLHASVDTGDSEGEGAVQAVGSRYIRAFMAPGALADDAAMQPAILAADCKNGRIGQKRRADVKIDTRNDRGYGSLVQAIVKYKRVSCARWNITHVLMTPIIPVPNRLWFRNFFYKAAWLSDGYGEREAGKQCRTLLYNETHDFQPDWLIRARDQALIELVDENPNAPGNGLSCIGGAGTSYTSGLFYLRGGVS